MKKQWFIIAVLFPIQMLSQENSTRPYIHTIATVGMAAGQSTVKPLGQIEAGFFRDRLFAGIGAGVDPYRFKSIPFFVDGRWHFGKMRSLFLYGNGGYNLPFDNRTEQENFFKTSDRFYGGLYMDAGIGYRVRLNSSQHILMSAGYSQKNLKNKVGFTYPCFMPPCEEMMYDYNYKLGRIVTKLSWEFGK
jgi:hypothetical protein